MCVANTSTSLNLGSKTPKQMPNQSRPTKIRDKAEACGVNRQGQERALRLRLYVLGSECASLIDLAEGNRQQREVEGLDLLRHAAEEHAAWLEVFDIRS
jgi:hypothetical protein